MNKPDGSKFLPIQDARRFLEEKALTDVTDTIRQVRERFDRKQALRIEKGLVVTELENKELFGEFCDRYWPNARTASGIRSIREYKRALNALSDTEFDDQDLETDDLENETSESTVGPPEYRVSIDESSFAYESDLRDYLVSNLHLIEPGLRLYYDEKGIEGVEYAIDDRNKRVDILAVDQHEIPVVIELKVSKGYEKVLGQSQYYKNRLKHLMAVDRVRVIIIAREITEHLKTAAMDVPDVQLFEYTLSIELNQVTRYRS